MATKKKSTAKHATKKSAGKKAVAKKSAAKKGAKKLMAVKAAAACTLTAITTTTLVADCAPGAPNIGATLEGAGLISQGQRDDFGDCVFQSVLAAGCLINRGAIPTGANTTLRDIVFAILGAIQFQP